MSKKDKNVKKNKSSLGLNFKKGKKVGDHSEDAGSASKKGSGKLVKAASGNKLRADDKRLHPKKGIKRKKPNRVSDEVIMKIRKACKKGELSQRAIAAKYKVAQSFVSYVHQKKVRADAGKAAA